MHRHSKLDIAFKSLMIIVIVIIALVLAGNLIMPILFSGMIAMILFPMARFFEKIGLHRGIAAFLTVATVSVVILFLISIVVIQSQEILKEVPYLIKNKENFLDINEIQIQSQAVLNYIEEHITTIEENIDAIKEGIANVLKNGVLGVKDTIIFLILCPIYIFFMLLCRDNIYRFVRSYHVKKEGGEKNEDIIQEVKDSLYHYLRGLFTIMTISGTLTFVGLYLVGIDYALFLGALTAFLTPIPYLGVAISATIPLILAILTKDSIWYTFGVLGVFAVVQFLEAYVFIPKVMGNNVNVNPLIIVLGLIVFGSVTGLIGMILTVPLLAITKVIIDYYPHLKPWRLLLEDRYLEDKK